MSRVLVYGDTSANIIDGSSIWLMSICQVLADVFDEVHLLLKFPPESDILLGPLYASERIVVHPPTGHTAPGRDPSFASIVNDAAKLDRDIRFDAIVVRGMEACLEFSSRPDLAQRLWSYITDLPFPPHKLSSNGQNRLNRLAHRSRRVFSQTQASRSYLEAISVAASGKTVIMSPMVPDEAFTTSDRAHPGDTLRLVYAGKFAREWRTLEMLELPRLLRERGVAARLTVVGSKFNRDSRSSTWPTQMQSALETAAADPESGVEWLGAVPRESSMSIMQQADIGIGWRTERLDSSLEISTKVLEYGASGAAPLLNDTLDHRSLFGSDYPLYARGTETVNQVADRIVEGLPELEKARERAGEVSRSFSMATAVDRLRAAFGEAGISIRDGDGDRHMQTTGASTSESDLETLLIAGHDFKFMGEINDFLKSDRTLRVSVDQWASLHEHEAATSTKLLKAAGVVMCEWAGPNLAWYSHNVQPNQRLLSRLHGFEARTGTWLDRIDFERVDALVVVSEYYRDLTLSRLPIAPEKVHVIPNMLDTNDFYRPKDPGAQFHLGMAGYVPFLKRPDRALALLERLLMEDDRYYLHIKGRPPWEYPHHWKNPIDKQLYYEFFNHIAQTPHLREHVVFEEFSPDIGSWFRKIGIVLSPSDHESFHMAPAEGMASGAVPIVWERDGAREVFGPHHVYASLDHMASRVLSLRESDTWEHHSQSAYSQASQSWDSRVVGPRWREQLHRNGQGALT